METKAGVGFRSTFPLLQGHSNTLSAEVRPEPAHSLSPHDLPVSVQKCGRGLLLELRAIFIPLAPIHHCCRAARRGTNQYSMDSARLVLPDKLRMKDRGNRSYQNEYFYL